jgi:Iap family predicted aminopeptidase
MKKFRSVLALVAVAALLLSACSGSTTVPEATETPSAVATEVPVGNTGVSLEQAQSAFVDCVDTSYAFELAERIMAIRSNEDLGYRTAGSEAELATGDLLVSEMEAIGLTQVTKDEFTLDTWTFDHAYLSYTDSEGVEQKLILASYQTTLVCDDEFTLIYLGDGAEADYEGVDVEGKVVLVDINQRDNWWINYPAYEAYVHGAAAIIAVQDGGYAEISDDALDTKDFCGPEYTPALSMSRADADAIIDCMDENGEITVKLDVDSQVQQGGTSYNIVGVIEGRDSDQMILMTSHYDAYFDGFQDDTAAVAMMMCAAKAIVDSGYQPEKTLVFMSTAAEEWGTTDTRYDWCTGAYNQIFRVHPEWAGKVVADVNFELPGYTLDYDTSTIRASYELVSFLNDFVTTVPEVEGAYPEGADVCYPTQTWSDDFSYSIAGIPGTVNMLEEDFATLYYHTPFDNTDTYDEAAFRYNTNMYGMLMLAYDRCAVSPLDFSTRLEAFADSIDEDMMDEVGIDTEALYSAVDAAKEAAAAAWQNIQAVNASYEEAVAAGDLDTADNIKAEAAELYEQVLAAFKQAEDAFVRLTWEDSSEFPHVLIQDNLYYLTGALEALEDGDAATAYDEYLWGVDNNWYGYFFSRETYEHFTNYVLEPGEDKLLWGTDMVISYVDLFDVIRSLEEKYDVEGADLSEEIAVLQEAVAYSNDLMVQWVEHEQSALESLTASLEAMA